MKKSSNIYHHKAIHETSDNLQDILETSITIIRDVHAISGNI